MTPWGSYLADCPSDLFITQTLPRPVTRRGTRARNLDTRDGHQHIHCPRPDTLAAVSQPDVPVEHLSGCGGILKSDSLRFRYGERERESYAGAV